MTVQQAGTGPAPHYPILPPGYYFDGNKGWRINCLIIRLAVNCGWTDEEAVKLANFTDEEIRETPHWLDLTIDAEDFIQAHCVPAGYHTGTAEGENGWGIWKDEDEEVAESND